MPAKFCNTSSTRNEYEFVMASKSAPSGRQSSPNRRRPLIAFFDYPDVFEDFYPHYHINQRTFATRWDGSGNHAFLSLIQREIGDVVWYAFSIDPEVDEARHETVGCRIKFVPSSWLHRKLWKASLSTQAGMAMAVCLSVVCDSCASSALGAVSVKFQRTAPTSCSYRIIPAENTTPSAQWHMLLGRR